MHVCNASDQLSWNKSTECEDLNNSVTFRSTDEHLPVGKAVAIGVILGSIAIGALIGNILVILSVFSNRRLRTVTNCFVVSLASSDLLVSVLVLPLGIKVEITGTWELGVILCDMWVSCDVMLCTASILNLCCISLDRYFAITNPLIYATKRSKRLALIMIAVVWVAAIVITCPPILGWQEAGRWEDDTHCQLTRDPGYIIYSSLGSFYVPLLIMIFVYARIFRVASQRDKNMFSYKCSFKCANNRKRVRTKYDSHIGYDYRVESMRLTENRDGEGDTGEGESRDDELSDMMLETSLDQHGGLHRGSGTCSGGGSTGGGGGGGGSDGKCLGARHLHKGLVMSSALAMTDITRTHRRNLQQQKSQTSPTTTSCATNSSGHLQNGRNKAGGYAMRKDERRRERAVLLRERKTAKTLAIVVGCFVLCWLPFFLMYVIEPFCASCYVPPTMATFFTWLGYFNSLINPFIYALYNKDFRHSFWQLTCGLLYKKQV